MDPKWDVEPIAQDYYDDDLESAIQATTERVEEWVWADDPHGYCHERPPLITLLDEIERLRGRVSFLTEELDEAYVVMLTTGGHIPKNLFASYVMEQEVERLRDVLAGEETP